MEDSVESQLSTLFDSTPPNRLGFRFLLCHNPFLNEFIESLINVVDNHRCGSNVPSKVDQAISEFTERVLRLMHQRGREISTEHNLALGEGLVWSFTQKRGDEVFLVLMGSSSSSEMGSAPLASTVSASNSSLDMGIRACCIEGHDN